MADSLKTPTETPPEEELLFIEDRRLGNISPFNLEPKERECKPKVTNNLEDFILLSSVDDQSSESDLKPEEGDSKMEELENSEISKHDKLKETEDLLLFIEDRNPILTGQETQSPRYSISKNLLGPQHDKESMKRKRLANTCWNCGETTHALRDCTEPKNFPEIARNRKEFQDSKGSMPVYRRYHAEETQSLAHLVPGKLSAELRCALGIDARELPSHIYMMRLLGYPPGWLQEAMVSHSGIAMFDGQGKEVAEPGAEAGDSGEQDSLDKFDIRKIIKYPGFNVPPPPDTHDDSEYWGAPPLSKEQSLEVMLDRLGGRVVGGYKRKRLSHAATGSSGSSPRLEDTSSAEIQDMEYEETPEGVELQEDSCKFIPPLPDQELPPPPPSELPSPPSFKAPEESKDSDVPTSLLSTSIEDTSLTELEEQKKLLLAQLNDVSPVCGTPESRIGKVKTMDLGTPLLKSVSPYSKLPSAEKFSVDICDVINFENLPDSTGKYDKISGIIRKVRVKMAEINSENI